MDKNQNKNQNQSQNDSLCDGAESGRMFFHWYCLHIAFLHYNSPRVKLE